MTPNNSLYDPVNIATCAVLAGKRNVIILKTFGTLKVKHNGSTKLRIFCPLLKLYLKHT